MPMPGARQCTRAMAPQAAPARLRIRINSAYARGRPVPQGGSMSLIAELKRRKVFKVGAAYLVVAWLVVQVGATVAPQLGLPEWAPRLITLLVLLGFPVSLVVAWMVDVTPEGLRLESAPVGNKRFFGIAAVLAALAVGWFLRGGVSGVGDAPATAEAPLGPQSTAVLPFVNMSADKDNEYFSDGLTETLLHKLAQVAELKVAARTSSFAFKGKNSDVRAIGTELGVATVVEGSVQRAGDTLRITAQLVRTADGSHIWSKSYDRKQADLFAIQDEIAGAVTEALVGALVPEAKAAIAAGGTADLAAYDDYARGLQERRRGNYESLTRAEQAMRQAIERDPKYVDAMLGLLDVWRDMHDTGMILRPEFIARTAPWLERIAALDPDNPSLMAYRAEHAREQGREAEAMALFERAVALAPADAELRARYGDFQPGVRNTQARLDQFDRAAELDPLNAMYHLNRAITLGQLRRYEEAEQAALRAAELDPGNVTVLVVLSDVSLWRGDLAGYLIGYFKARRVDARDHEIAALLAVTLDEIGERDAADAWLAEGRRLKPGNLPTEAAAVRIHFARGQHEAALAAALAISSRHDEERRADWVTAMSAGCLAAHELGRTAELRAAMERVKVVPAEFTPQGFEALVGPRYDLRHQFSHVGRIAPCLFEPGAAGSARRTQLLQTIVALLGPDWAQERAWWYTDGLLRDDRARMVEAVLPEPGMPDPLLDLPRSLAMNRWRGTADDPAIKALVARIEARQAQARAALPARLAAEGLSLTP